MDMTVHDFLDLDANKRNPKAPLCSAVFAWLQDALKAKRFLCSYSPGAVMLIDPASFTLWHIWSSLEIAQRAGTVLDPTQKNLFVQLEKLVK